MASDDRHVLTLIGAGSAVFTRGLLADLISARDLGSWEIRLVDVDATALRTAQRLAQRMVEARGVGDRVRVVADLNRDVVLPGSDFVVTCIGIGGRPAWQADHEITMRHGVYQPVGDSVLPGGISRLLRTVPVMVEVARDIADLAPDALYFNYSNPMTANVMAVAKYVGSNVVGLCHGMHHIHRELAEFIGKPLEETSTLYGGINHLTFIYDFRWRGQDAWPLVRERLDADLRGDPDPAVIGSIFPGKPSVWYHPFCWELFRRYGAFPAAGDRHVTEFFPERWAQGSYFGKTLGVDAFSVPEILEWGENRYTSMRKQADGEVPLDETAFDRSSGEQEQLIAIIRAIVFDRRETFSCNVVNNDIMAGIPADAAPEVPGIATARGIRAMAVPDLGGPLTAILNRRLSSVYLAMEAAMSGDRGLVVEAMLADGGVTDTARAEALTDDLLAGQAQYLPRFA
jgi:alpha-galactosidase